MPRFVANKKQNDTTEFTGTLSGDIIGPQNNTQISSGVITNTDINANAAIADTKLATISTSGKIANTATTATSSATANTIALRDNNSNTTFNTVFSNLDATPSGTLNIGATNATTLNLGTASTTQIVNVGTGSGVTTINLGGAGDTVNIAGDLTYVNTTNLNVTDSNIILNKGGAAGSAANSGLTLDEGGFAMGYLQTDGTRANWIMKAPASTGVATFSPGSSGININQSSHDPLTLGTANGLTLSTQQLSLGAASSSTTGALTNTDWSTFNNAASSVTSGLNGDVTGALNNCQIAAGAIVNADINANAAIVDTKLATISTAGKVSNSATTATSAATANAIMARDSNGACSVKSMSINPGTYMGGALSILSGNAGNYISMALGRTITDLEIAVAGSPGNFLTDATTSDVIFRHTNTSKLMRFSAGTSTTLAIGQPSVTSSSVSTGSVIINGGLGVSGNITSGTLSTGDITTGNISLANGGTYRNIALCGGNSNGYLFGYWPSLGDGIHLSYNYVINNNGTVTIPNSGGATSRVSVGYGAVSLCAGGTNTAPTEYLRINNSAQILAQNGAAFVGPLTGNVTGNVTGNLTGNVTGNVTSNIIKIPYPLAQTVSCAAGTRTTVATQARNQNGAINTKTFVLCTLSGSAICATSLSGEISVCFQNGNANYECLISTMRFTATWGINYDGSVNNSVVLDNNSITTSTIASGGTTASYTMSWSGNDLRISGTTGLNYTCNVRANINVDLITNGNSGANAASITTYTV